jgi:hypothetical protein
MSDEQLSPKKKLKKRKSSVETEKTRSKPDDHGRVLSYVVGVFFLLLGGGMIIGFDYVRRAPEKVFFLLMGGGAGALLSGLGLLIQPMNEDQLNVFQSEPNPIAVFKVMTPFWKVWLIVILAGMIGGFVYATQNTVRVGV